MGSVHSIALGGTNTSLRRAQWTVYKDDLLETWVGQGYQKTSDSSFTLINPVQITRKDRGGRVIDEIGATRGSDVTSSGKLQVLEERTGTSESAERWFVWGVRSIDDLVRRERDSEPLYVLGDALNVTAVINASGIVQERYGYTGFGTVRYMNASFGSIGNSGKNWDTLFGSYRYDTESGLYQVRYRFLHPALGRWITRDTLGYHDGANLYASIKNNPIHHVDSSGLCTWRKTGHTVHGNEYWLYFACEGEKRLIDSAEEYTGEFFRGFRYKWEEAECVCYYEELQKHRYQQYNIYEIYNLYRTYKYTNYTLDSRGMIISGRLITIVISEGIPYGVEPEENGIRTEDAPTRRTPTNCPKDKCDGSTIYGLKPDPSRINC